MNRQSEMTVILSQARTIAVVGLSDNPARPSHGVASYMQSHGYRIIPVNPNHKKILGEVCYSSLTDIPRAVRIDLVNIFRRPEVVMPVVEQTIQIGARSLWMQEGVINYEAARKAEEAGLCVVMDRCLMVEHSHYVLQSS